ncbi:1-acyl-sn-glycerol-3-phosphate acyltransferase [Lewinella aquimaris]|uniref:1-acyl-sn-glycerol-3-phosphate acyltransferase n=1 Tax=Neolewinella aquimaris TaxID=1835722 RepID=A0A840E4J3_9BACT|nr:1-acyl-sn-glycerol-3-phosphate acyltransferase [Neolewinella aquimaris]MBB4079990.1 1-acyl-sn-glycerol-3-phosphate acyltransferase [Neolewinella aquimaris]
MSKPFFWVLHFLSRWMLRTFYPAMETEGVHYANHPGPTLLCGNHPNTLADPLMAGIHLDYQTYFLANAGLWMNPVTAFIIDPFCIPVARPKDKEAGADKGSKEEVFNRTFNALETGKIMYIAPEAYSELERKLRKVKAGAASLALEGESRNGWKLGITLQPVGINYESPTTCFSRAFVRYGEPIVAAEWREQYEKSPMRAVRGLTNLLSERMEGLLIHTKNKTEERCLRRIDRSVQNDRPMTVSAHHYRTQRILTWLRELGEDQRESLCALASEYDSLLRAEGRQDLEYSSHPRRNYTPGLFLALPLFLYGLINHLPWLVAINAIWKALGIDRGYKATVQTLGSWVVLPLLYLLQTLLLNWIYPGGQGWLYLLSLPVSGLFALRYWVTYRAFWAGRFSGRSKSHDRLQSLRNQLMAALPAFDDSVSTTPRTA